ncbi:MAG: glutaredoxin family protein [Burkholderiales bacterium]|nr:MAG: glutaredoxin family protein [Burkholderiales bacterium]
MLPRSLLVVVALAALASWAWRGHVERADARALRNLAQPGDIRMISSETCAWCTAARRWMTAQQVPFSECFIERDARCQADYQALGAQGTPTFLVRGQRIVGFDRARVADALQLSRPAGR